MKRRLFNLLAGVSLLWCLMFGAVWIWSHTEQIICSVHWKEHRPKEFVQVDHDLSFLRGQITLHTDRTISKLEHDEATSPARTDFNISWWRNPVPPAGEGFSYPVGGKGFVGGFVTPIGFFFLQYSMPVPSLIMGGPVKLSPAEYHSVQNTTQETRYVGLPLWAIVLMIGIVPLVWIKRCARRLHRVKKGLCRVCGYDLRATPDRCPECGTAQK